MSDNRQPTATAIVPSVRQVGLVAAPVSSRDSVSNANPVLLSRIAYHSNIRRGVAIWSVPIVVAIANEIVSQARVLHGFNRPGINPARGASYYQTGTPSTFGSIRTLYYWG